MRSRGKRQRRKKTKKRTRNRIRNRKRTKKGGASMAAIPNDPELQDVFEGFEPERIPDELNSNSPLWLSFKAKLSNEGLSPSAIEFITRSHIHFLSLQIDKPELYARIRGYIAEFTSLEKLNLQDYPTLSALFRKFMSPGGKLNYLTDTLNVLWELCAVYKPEMVKNMTDEQSLELFKDCLRAFFREGYDLDQDLVEQRTQFMVDYMELWRGVRGANQKEVEKLKKGDSYQFLSLLSLSFDVNSATKFSDPSNPVLCLFKVEHDQAVPGIVVSTELYGPPSESEVLTGAGFTAIYEGDMPKKMEIGGIKYTVKVFKYIGTNEVINEKVFEECLSKLTFEEMSRKYTGEVGHNPPPERANELSETYLGAKGTGKLQKLQGIFEKMARKLKSKSKAPRNTQGNGLHFRALETESGLAAAQQDREEEYQQKRIRADSEKQKHAAEAQEFGNYFKNEHEPISATLPY